MWSQRESSDEAPLLVRAESAVCVLFTSWLLVLLGLDSASVVIHWSPVNPKSCA